MKTFWVPQMARKLAITTPLLIKTPLNKSQKLSTRWHFYVVKFRGFVICERAMTTIWSFWPEIHKCNILERMLHREIRNFVWIHEFEVGFRAAKSLDRWNFQIIKDWISYVWEQKRKREGEDQAQEGEGDDSGSRGPSGIGPQVQKFADL